MTAAQGGPPDQEIGRIVSKSGPRWNVILVGRPRGPSIIEMRPVVQRRFQERKTAKLKSCVRMRSLEGEKGRER